MDEITKVVRQLRKLGFKLSIEYSDDNKYVVRVLDKFGVFMTERSLSISASVREVAKRLVLDYHYVLEDDAVEQIDIEDTDNHEVW